MEPAEALRTACSQNLHRLTLNYHRDFPRDPKERSAAIRQYRVWILKRCSSPESIAALIEAAMEKCKRRPTIAELAEIFAELHPAAAPQTYAPELTPEEQAQRDEFMRKWRAEEAEAAADRRRKYLEIRDRKLAGKPSPPAQPPVEVKPITPEDIDRAVRDRAAAKAEGGGE